MNDGGGSRADGNGAGLAAVRPIPWAYSLAGAAQLPLTGEDHPLRREFVRWLAWACVATLVLAGVALGVYQWWSHREPERAPVARQVKIVRYTDLGVPPSIARPSAPQVNWLPMVTDCQSP